MGYPYSNGDVLSHSDMNAVGLHLITPSSVTGGTLSGSLVSITSGVSEIEIAGAFSANFRDYTIVVSNYYGSASTDLRMELGSATSGYFWASHARSVAGTTDDDASGGPGSSTFWVGYTSTTEFNSTKIDVYVPQLAKRTQIAGYGTGQGYAHNFGGYQSGTTAYTAFTRKPLSGTLSGGQIRVYGYGEG